MSERHNAIDGIGNVIRKGGLVHVSLPAAGAIFHVADVQSASIVGAAAAEGMSMDGNITLVCRIPFRPGKQLPNFLVLKVPDEEKAPVIQLVNDEAAVRKN